MGTMTTQKQSVFEKIYDEDIWPAEQIGLVPDHTHSRYFFNFSHFKQSWLKDAMKKFIRYQSSIKTFSTCLRYIDAMINFSKYLDELDFTIRKDGVNRKIMLGFISYLTTKQLSPSTKGKILIHFRTFHLIVFQEKWLPWPGEPLIFTNDIPKGNVVNPRHIPEKVIAQLKQHLHHLQPFMQSVVTILLETGRRVSEVCPLPFDCLEKDKDGDWFLQVHEKKMKRTRLIPISNDAVSAIKAQQQRLDINQELESEYLFPPIKRPKSPYINALSIYIALNKLANQYKIIDDNGKIWKFSSHQFRHTLGTRMINTGVPQVMVQHYLGHESSEMTSRYAHIHNDTMKAAFIEYENKIVDIYGKVEELTVQQEGAWLKQNLKSQALPNGLCTLPMTQNRCPHANACLSCAHFRTSKEHLPKHETQLTQTYKIINNAKENGWQRLIEMNQVVADNLEKIISKLKEKTSEE